MYYLDGDRIMAERTGDTVKYYYYDGTGIAAVREGSNFYYVEKNLFGDVVRVYDSAGTMVASYSYDAWGYPLETSGSKADLVPFRYRGYYYDEETGLYYLNSRYYDPEIRRFVNADNVEILAELSQNLGELNLYAYCNNNPVMHSDPSGEFAITGTFIAVFFLFCMVFLMAMAYNTGSFSYGGFEGGGQPGVYYEEFDIIKFLFGDLGEILYSKSKGRGKDSELAKKYPNTEEGRKSLEDAIKKTPKKGGERNKLIRHAKILEIRNTKKRRQKPVKRRGDIGWLFLPEIIRRVMNNGDRIHDYY